MLIKWTDEMTELLIHYYPYETNEWIAALIGVTKRTVINRARKLGLEKSSRTLYGERIRFISENFMSMSNHEIGEQLGISKVQVARLAGSLDLNRSYKDRQRLNTIHRNNLVSRERRRLIFGLEPVSDIKIVTNRPRIKMRYRLKQKGYIQSDDRNTLFYSSDEMRDFRGEASAAKLGLRFLPLPPSAISDSEI